MPNACCHGVGVVLAAAGTAEVVVASAVVAGVVVTGAEVAAGVVGTGASVVVGGSPHWPGPQLSVPHSGPG